MAPRGREPVRWLSLPPVLAIGLAIASRLAIPSLLAGVGAGWLIVTGEPSAAAAAARGIGDVLANPGQARVVLFTILMGGPGPVDASRAAGSPGSCGGPAGGAWSDSRRGARLMAATVGLGVFIESTITCLVVGAVARPFFDRHGIAREKLAYICDATSAPVCMLIPLNSWGAVVLALLAAQAELGRLGERSPLGVFLAAAPLNFYAILSVVLVFVVAATGYDVGPMRRRRAPGQGGGGRRRTGPRICIRGPKRPVGGRAGARPGEDGGAWYEAARDERRRAQGRQARGRQAPGRQARRPRTSRTAGAPTTDVRTAGRRRATSSPRAAGSRATGRGGRGISPCRSR